MDSLPFDVNMPREEIEEAIKNSTVLKNGLQRKLCEVETELDAIMSRKPDVSINVHEQGNEDILCQVETEEDAIMSKNKNEIQRKLCEVETELDAIMSKKPDVSINVHEQGNEDILCQVETEEDAIMSKNKNELQRKLCEVETELDAIMSKKPDVSINIHEQGNEDIFSQVDTEVDAILSKNKNELQRKLCQVETEVDAIMSKKPDDSINVHEQGNEDILCQVETEEDAIMSKNKNELQRKLCEVETELDAIMSKKPDVSINVHEHGNENIVNNPIVENKNATDSKLINRRALPDDAETYELEKFEKKLLVIFNHENFEIYDTPRFGTKKDVTALTQTFEKIGFTVIEHRDLEKKQVLSELESMADKDFNDYGCVAVAVLTHGNDYSELMAKDTAYTQEDIIEHLKIHKNYTLITKPRLLIIQACRGTGDMEGVPVLQPPLRKLSNSENELYFKLPLGRDMLVIHSCYAGKPSHRTKEGTWFIQTLCQKIDELALKEDLDSILICMKRAVAIDLECKQYSRKKEREVINKQMPKSISTLRRKLYLRKYQEM